LRYTENRGCAPKDRLGVNLVQVRHWLVKGTQRERLDLPVKGANSWRAIIGIARR